MSLKHTFYSCALAFALLFMVASWSTEYGMADTSQAVCYPSVDSLVFTSTSTTESPIEILIQRYATKLNLDVRVLRAVIAHESEFVVTAYNPDDPSYGLGQVMPKYWRYAFVKACGSEATPETLMDPEINICYSAHILRFFMDEYGPVAGVDAYNNGTGEARGYSDHVLRGI